MRGITFSGDSDFLLLKINKFEEGQLIPRLQDAGWKLTSNWWEYIAPFSVEILDRTVYGKDAILPDTVDAPAVQQRYIEIKGGQICVVG